MLRNWEPLGSSNVKANKSKVKSSKLKNLREPKKTPLTTNVSRAPSCDKSELESVSRYNTRATSHFQDQFTSTKSRNGDNLKNYKSSSKIEFDKLDENSDQESMNCKLARTFKAMKSKNKPKKKPKKKNDNWLKKVQSQKYLIMLEESDSEASQKAIGFSNYESFRRHIWDCDV